MTVEVFAPAKINLTLHVTGQRPDTYHLIDSLVGFASVGDRIIVSEAKELSLEVEGPFAQALSDEADNLVLRAARLFGSGRGARIRLIKHLPVASGLGGGSADAAATLHALARLWDIDLPPLAKIAALGADIPACVQGGFSRIEGVGEIITPLAHAPRLRCLLVNPGVPLATREVFAGLEHKTNPPMEDPLPSGDTPNWLGWLQHQRNDLERPARAIAPVIGEVLAALSALPGCRLARMTGSGATCFALFDEGAECHAEVISAQHEGWWIAEAGSLSAA